MSYVKTTWFSAAINSAELFLFATLMSVSSLATSNEPSHTDNSIELQLRSLIGYWDGEAVTTPVGPINYDIYFHDCGDGTISGVAKTGASLHYWKFRLHHDYTRLRFLSTFRGNRTPTLLQLQEFKGATLKYRAPKLELLTLEVTFTKPIVDFRVFHHGRPHVHIRLNHTGVKPQQQSPHHTLSNSCRGSPAQDSAAPQAER